MEQKIKSFRPRVFRFIVQFVKNETLAEDLTQDVMLKVWLRKERISCLSDIENYILKIAKHHVIDHFKKLAKEKAYQEEIWQFLQKSSNNTERILMQKEIDRTLEMLIKTLPPRQQEIFILNKIDGVSIKEIAKILDIEPRTVRNHLNRALKTLQTHCNIDLF